MLTSMRIPCRSAWNTMDVHSGWWQIFPLRARRAVAQERQSKRNIFVLPAPVPQAQVSEAARSLCGQVQGSLQENSLCYETFHGDILISGCWAQWYLPLPLAQP